MTNERQADAPLIAAAAIMHSNRVTQKMIASKLDVDQSTVSRLLRKAKDNGWLTKPQVDYEAIPHEVTQQAQAICMQEDHLIERLNHWAPSGTCGATVFYGTQGGDTFYRLAAKALNSLIKNRSKVGVMYGRTLWRMAELLKHDATDASTVTGPQLRNYDFVPLCGEPVHLMDQDDEPPSHSASHIAEQLQRLSNNNRNTLEASMSGVHAYVKIGDDRDSIKDYFKQTPGYQRIFTNKEALIDRINAIVTGIGAFSSFNTHRIGGLMQERLLQEPSISGDDLEEIAHGDLGGIIIGKKKLSPDAADTIKRLNDGWLGLKKRHIKACAKSAKPGVIVISQDPERAGIIKAATREGLINHIIISASLSEKLKELPA